MPNRIRKKICNDMGECIVVTVHVNGNVMNNITHLDIRHRWLDIVFVFAWLLECLRLWNDAQSLLNHLML